MLDEANPPKSFARASACVINFHQGDEYDPVIPFNQGQQLCKGMAFLRKAMSVCSSTLCLTAAGTEQPSFDLKEAGWEHWLLISF